MMKPLAFTLILLAGLLTGCDQSSDSSALSDEGMKIVDPLVGEIIEGYELEHSNPAWAGGGGGDRFGYSSTAMIKNAKIDDIASRVSQAVGSIKSQKGVSYEGGGEGTSDLGHGSNSVRYTKNGAAYFTDFIYYEYPAKEEFFLEGGVRLVIQHRGAR